MKIKSSLTRRVSTANACRFPMWLISIDIMHDLYGERHRVHDAVMAHQYLKEQGNMLRWKDLPYVF